MVVAVRQPRLLVIAGDIGLGGDQFREFDNDLAPVAALAQPANPVGTQFLGDVGTLVAIKEGAHGRAVVLIHVDAQLVVFDVGREFVIAELPGSALQLVAVAGAKGVAGGEIGAVAAFLREKRQ